MKRKASSKVPSSRPTPDPSLWWIACLLLGSCATLGLQKPEELGPPPWLAEQGIVLDPHYLLIMAVVVALAGLVGALRYRKLYAFARRHPDEPWLWDHSWRRVLVDEQLSKVLARLPRFLAVTFVLLILNGISLAFLVMEGPIVGFFAFGLFAIVYDVMLLPREILPYVRDVLALLRYGRTRLHLPGIPLALGKQSQVELEVPRGLEKLTQVRAVLRNVRERQVHKRVNGKQRLSTVRDVEYERVQKVEPGRESGRLYLVLNVPDTREAGSVLCTHPRVLWELQLTSEVPGLDLDVTFLLPVYAVTGKRRDVGSETETPRESAAS